MTIFARAGALFLVALLAACYPTTEQPIGSSSPQTADARLLGAWKSQPTNPKDGPNYVFFLARDGNKLEAVTVYPPHGDDKGSWMSFAAWTGKIGKADFLNGQQVLDNGELPKDASKDYTPVYYRFDGDTLRLFVFGEQPLEDAIAKGKIKGEVKKNMLGDDIRITSDAKTLDAFIATHDPKTLFTELLGTYQRVK